MTNRWSNPINNNILRDLEGTVLASGSVAFYTAGTSTPLAVYSDPELAVSLGSYIDADAFGLLPDFHLASGTQYKMVAYDAIGGAGGAGAVKWTRDDVFGLDSAVDTRLDGIEASIAALEQTGRNSILNAGCSAEKIGEDGVVITAPSLTTSFAEGQAIAVRAKVANVTAGTQAIGYSTDIASGAYLHLTGVTTNNVAATADAMFQVISGEACRFINQQVTFRCKVYHDIGSAKNFTITVATLNSRDDVSAYTTVLAGSATSISDSTWTSISLTVPDMGNCSNGIVVIVSGAVGTITTKEIRFAEAQIDIGSTLTAFLENEPAVVEGALNYQNYALALVQAAARRESGFPYINGIGSVETITSGSGNWTVPAGVYRVKYTITAGGGGGGGIGGAETDGTDGSNTTFNTTIIASGGKKGVLSGVDADGGIGGTATGGTINIPGGGGGSGGGSSDSKVGGASYWGGGGAGARTSAAGKDADAYGGGGSGGAGSANAASSAGAGGTCIGVLTVTPGDLIPYSVGAGGTGGAGDFPGGDGKGGIIVLEY